MINKLRKKIMKILEYLKNLLIVTVMRVSQKFCKILLTWSIIQHLSILLKRSWRWQITLDCEMPSLSDTLWMLLAGFASMAWSMASEPLVLGLPFLALSLRFLQTNQNIVNHLFTILWSTAPSFFSKQSF